MEFVVSQPTAQGQRPANVAIGNIRHCKRCHVPYDWRRSASGSLKMTYCGSLCEAADLGFTLESILRAETPTAHSRQLPLAA